MSEIEKLYENAGVAKIGIRKCTTCEYLDCQNYCFISENNKCNKFSYQYPSFTAEKQIELIKWFVINNAELETLEITYYLNDCFQISSCAKSSHFETDFENAIAGLINAIWQDLNEEERKQIKEILE